MLLMFMLNRTHVDHIVNAVDSFHNAVSLLNKAPIKSIRD